MKRTLLLVLTAMSLACGAHMNYHPRESLTLQKSRAVGAIVMGPTRPYAFDRIYQDVLDCVRTEDSVRWSQEHFYAMQYEGHTFERDIDAVQWFVVKDGRVQTFPCPNDSGWCKGWWQAPDTIYLSEAAVAGVNDYETLRHELVHLFTQNGVHMQPVFNHCAGFVDDVSQG